MKSSCAILLFSNAAFKDAACKNLLPGKPYTQNKNLSSLLISDTHLKLKLTGLPVFCTGPVQTGNTFGEKLANAIEKVFDDGFEKVIVVGNDCPELSTAKVVESVHLLTQTGVVIGPDKRGGIYLVGFNKKDFDKKSFEMLPWQTAQLLTAFTNHLNSKAVTNMLLCVYADINSHLDFDIINWNNCRRSQLFYFYQCLVTRLCLTIPELISFCQLYLLRVSGLRAPPYNFF